VGVGWLLGLRRHARAPRRLRPRRVARPPAVVQRARRDDGRLLSGHDADGDRDPAPAAPRGDRPDLRHQPLVRLRL
jgi:hypothetical protein